ncbi:phosphoglycerate mutase family protein-like protein [Penicillium angulare]|uniref:phosphoglycerate mutase family protein-like protein n=1 Tax=Penicillium angulare TaxID=116970 RepID=UPI002540BF01|nr:phosphoglycerate mutase family protein-like protein [Penicillium angulare]KAJ5279995.1 phosphoglycerate mutase family protein-like protein [Penicillium angulare]
MPPTLYIIRHAQGEHNDSHHIRDALLTDTGKFQCQELQEKFPFLQDVEVILASPLRRTIQTAAYTFAPELEKRQLPMILVPNAQEISSLACDVGHDAKITKSEAPNLIKDAAPSWNAMNLDATLVNESWNSKFEAYIKCTVQKGIYESSLPAVKQRAAEMRNWIYSRPEKHVALVTHGGFLHYFTEDWRGYVRRKGTGYLNCEYRKLEFTEDSNENESHLRECGSILEKEARPVGLDAHVIHEIGAVEGFK